ncbi:MAG: FkbM family methyltransferase [Jatrophihabitantaceae bacterium]
MSQLTGLPLARYEARRVAQTRRAFANWPELLRGLAGEKVGRSGDTLTFVTRTGVRLTCPNVPGARLPMYEQFADDCYDLAWVLGTRLDHPLQVLDVGSHVGAFATNLATARDDVRVECYEPSPDTARYLQDNVDQNCLSARVHVYEKAMAGAEGSALLDDNSGASVHNGLVRQDHRLVDGDDAPGRRATISVATTTFDKAVADAPAPLDVVKLDCEGGEYELVYASSTASWASVQRVVMEYHPVESESWDELRAWFADVGLHAVRHESDSPGLGTAWLERRSTR